MALTDTMAFTESTDLVPGVDIVLPVGDTGSVVLDYTAQKLIGVLHRRFWNRRRDMLQLRATSRPDESTVVAPALEVDAGIVFEARVIDATSWTERLEEFDRLSDAINERDELSSGVAVLAARGWEMTEAGVLVDGRAVPGCVFDLAVAAASVVGLLRDGEPVLAVSMPAPSDPTEAKLYADLVRLAEDRLGVERGTIRFGF